MYLYDEPREIKSITVGVTEGCSYYAVGRNKYHNTCAKVVTKIVAEQVGGEMGYVTWFCIYAGEELLARVNQSFVSEIGY